MAKNNKRFSVLIPAANKYIPIVRRYIVEVLSAFDFSDSALYQMEVIVDELCQKIQQDVKKSTSLLWFDMRFDVSDSGFAFELSEQRQDYLFFSDKQSIDSGEDIMDSAKLGIIERYCNSARFSLIDGKVKHAMINRSLKEE